MKTTIQAIIQDFDCGTVFDAHAIIQYLIQNNSDLYLSSYGNNVSTELYHSHIAKIIASFEGSLITRIQGESWSKNIRDNFTKCTCWQRN